MGRWDYMGQPSFNPPNDDCPECKEASRTYFVGAKKVDGVTQRRYTCEHKHEWIEREGDE
jgi:hypothetical protein